MGDSVRARQPGDEVLARRAALGDRVAFAEIFDRHAATLFRYAVNMVDGDEQAAEDAVQDSLTKAWQNLSTFRGESGLRTWLLRITAHQVLNTRKRRRPVVLDDELLSAFPADDTSDPVTSVISQELWTALGLALAELPWRQRGSWLLREVEGLSYPEIAEVLDTTPTVVRGQLHRARATLAVRMAQWR